MTNPENQASDEDVRTDSDVAEQPADGTETAAETIEFEVADNVAEELNAADETAEGGDLAAQLKDAEDRVLRAQAEIENVRRRSRREIDEQRKFANQPLLSDLLPVIDNLERAVSAASDNAESDGLKQGVTMVLQQLLDTLGKHHCQPIPAQGETFDPNMHEAIQQMPSDLESGLVCQVVQAGYQLHDRVVRPSQVIISTGPADA